MNVKKVLYEKVVVLTVIKCNVWLGVMGYESSRETETKCV